MKDSRFGFTVAQKDPDVLELDVYDVIGDTWEEDAVTAKRVRAQLREARASRISVRINSLGGDVQDALSIYNQLKEHPAEVEVRVDGAAASAATIIAMAASPGRLRMAEASEFMIHEPRFDLMWGVDAAKARKAADRLDKESGILAGIYAKRSERSEEEIRDWMHAETWFTAAEALEAGLIDGLDDESPTASISPTMAAAALQRFRNVPERMVARAGLTPVHGNGGALVGVSVPHPPRERAGASASAPPAGDGESSPSQVRVVTPELRDALHTHQIPAAAVAAEPQPAAAVAATNTEIRMDPKTIARDLGLPEDTTEAQIRTAATAAVTDRKALLDALGVSTVDAARGVIEAGRAASAELPKAQARIAELEKATEDAERASTVAKLEAEKRLTPPLREFVANCPIETLRAFAKVAPVVVAESPHHEAEPGAAASPAAPATLDGKRSYEHLTGPERIALRDSDRATFDTLRNDWLSRGQPIANTAG
jgi:ATP-dependent protease ClpP protease subunit